MTTPLINTIVTQLGMKPEIVTNIIELLDQWNTVPFIARYRKELTEGTTDEQLRHFHDLYSYTKNLEARKADVIRLIAEKGLMTPELEAQIMAAETLARVEDLYRPFKEKKNTKATIAKAKGLDPLADILRACMLTKEEFEAQADAFIKETDDKKTSVASREEAIQGAKDIVAEDVSDDATLRDDIRTFEEQKAVLTTKPTKTFEENWVYKIYANYSKALSDMPSYAYLAVSRAEDEKQLSLSLQLSYARIVELAKKAFVPKDYNTTVDYLMEALEDGLQRLLLPSIEREIRSNKKRRADEAAIKVFGDNMKHLLLAAPVKGMTVLWYDPAFRTGCKLAVVDPTGKFLTKTVIYPTEPQNDVVWAEKVILDFIKKYNIELIVIGNGTASRESESFVSALIKKNNLTTKYIITSESGASVYSASALAQEEYPDLDVTIRGAISIAHRVQDPLAELTKIDPKAIGVGQYQHDVDQKLLQYKLDEKVEDIVNSVWVDVNTASYPLLQYIAWLTAAIAKNIVAYRDENGPFASKAQIKKVKGLWPKAFEQCIGFLRITGGEEPLDTTGIHPEIYDKVYDLLKKEFQILSPKEFKKLKKADQASATVLQLPLPESLTEKVTSAQLEQRAETYGVGYETLNDVIKELHRPWLDPRDDLPPPQFKSDVLDIEHVQVGMIFDGVVRNVTDFGAFVDIGLHSDGLVHKSQLADRFVAHPSDVVHVGQQVKVRVTDIDIEREKISLSMKDWSGASTGNSGAAGWNSWNSSRSSSQSTPPTTSQPSRDRSNDRSMSESVWSWLGSNIAWK